jgi:glycosyltransferase involved in cell wall biosynthesis
MSIIEKDKVTIYLLNHNYGKFINESIKSVINQTYKKIELIIIDNNSKDNSKKIIEKYRNKKNIKIIYQRNYRLAKSNNIAIKNSTGDYIMRLDADDWLDPFAIEIMVSFLIKNKKTNIIYPDYYVIDENGEVTEQIRRSLQKKVKLKDQPSHGACTLIKTSFIKEIGGYDEAFTRNDGYDLWLSSIKKTSIQNINLPLFYYRKHNNNLTSNFNKILEAKTLILKKKLSFTKSKLKTIAIIPHRGIFNEKKNFSLKKINGKELICYTINTFLRSEKILKVVVTTPDRYLISFLRKKYKKRVIYFLRDFKDSLINKSLNKTLLDVVKYMKKKIKFNSIIHSSINNPFRSLEKVEELIHAADYFNTDIVIPIQLEKSLFYFHNGKSLKPIGNHEKLKIERKQIYREVGNMRFYRVKSLSKKSLNNVGHILIGSPDNIDITESKNFNYKI